MAKSHIKLKNLNVFEAKFQAMIVLAMDLFADQIFFSTGGKWLWIPNLYLEINQVN
jgi:hypothetical protein